jgi:hypothetical protein
MPVAPTTTQDKLVHLLSAINRDESAFSPRLSFAPNGLEGQNIGALTPADLLRLFKLATVHYPSADIKMGAAFSMGRLSWAILRPIAGYAMNNMWLDAADLAAFTLHLRQVSWHKNGQSGTMNAADISLDSAQTAWRLAASDEDVVAHFTQMLEQLFTPLVEAHHEASGLAKPALWRLVGDSLATAFLVQGENFNCVMPAMLIAEQILKSKSSKLFAKQSGFIQIKLPERPEISEWFRKRGGCCRYYTSDGGEYCSTCVLRDEDSMIARLQTHLRDKYAEEHAA